MAAVLFSSVHAISTQSRARFGFRRKTRWQSWSANALTASMVAAAISIGARFILQVPFYSIGSCGLHVNDVYGLPVVITAAIRDIAFAWRALSPVVRRRASNWLS